MRWAAFALAVVGSLVCGSWLVVWAKPGQKILGARSKVALLVLGILGVGLLASSAALCGVRSSGQTAREEGPPLELSEGASSEAAAQKAGNAPEASMFTWDIKKLVDLLPTTINGYRLVDKGTAVRAIPGHTVEEVWGLYLPVEEAESKSFCCTHPTVRGSSTGRTELRR